MLTDGHHNYFEVNSEQLLEEINRHEVISFSVEDTLLTYIPLLERDVELIVQNRIESSSVNDPKDEQRAGEIRSRLLMPREKMTEIYNQCIKSGKEVYLLTNLAMTRQQMETLLKNNGIMGYNGLIMDGESGNSSKRDILDWIARQVKGKSWLHVGTHSGIGADDEEKLSIAFCVDVFQIKSVKDMLEISLYAQIGESLHTVNERSLVGMFCASVFNDPFALYSGDGRPEVTDIAQVAYLFVAPLIANFMLWLIEFLRKESCEDILFAARDGYLIQELYNIYKDYTKEKLPKGQYFLTSRRSASSAAIFGKDEIDTIFSMPYEKEPENILQEKFYLKTDEIPRYNETRYKGLMEYTREHQELICHKAMQQRKGYLRYIEKQGLKVGKRYFFFDLATSGTTQYYLQKFVPFNLKGLSLLTYDVGDEGKRKLTMSSLYRWEEKRDNSPFEEYFRWNYAFLEPMLTAPETSVYSFDQKGTPLYGPEERTDGEVQLRIRTQAAIKDFFEIYLKKLYIKGVCVDKEIPGQLYCFKDQAYTWEHCELLDEYVSRDDMGAGMFGIGRQ